MREYWYFIPLVGVIFALMTFQITEYNPIDYSEIPDQITNIKDIKYIKIDGLNVSIKFDPTTTNLYYSDNMKVKRVGEKLFLNSKNINEILEIVIGSSQKFENVEIDGLNINLDGSLNSKILRIDGTNIVINKNFIFDGEKIIFDGTNVVLKGRINSNNINIDSISMSIEMNVEKTEIIKLDGISVAANITFLDIWEGIRKIFIDSITTDVIVRMKKENKGEVQSNKNIKIIKH